MSVVAYSTVHPIVAESILKISTVRDRRYSNWLNRFAWFTAAATLLLICSGGMVTSKNAGLAVPDWPTTFGYNMFLFPVSKWIGGIFFEHTHRLIASTVGFLTIILAAWLWRTEDRQLRNLGLIAVGVVILQGILGGLRVTMLKDQIGVFHACLAQAFLGLIVFVALATTKFWRSIGEPNPDSARSFVGAAHQNSSDMFGRVRARLVRVGRIALITTVAIYFQLALGATMRHQHKDLALLDFPTANGQWLPDTSPPALAKMNAWRDTHGLSDVTAFQIWLQMVHRFLAAVIAIAVVGFCLRVWSDVHHISILRRLAVVWVVVVGCQLALGAWTIWSNKAADIATAHVASGAIMLSLGVSISAICWRIAHASGNARSTVGIAAEATAI